MKILVISDTHGNIDRAEEIIRSSRNIDLIIHLGDYFRDAEKLAYTFPGIPIEYVYGNCDFTVDNVPDEKLLEFEGKRIFITHGHKYSVKWGYDKLCYRGEEVQADLVLFGHTHMAELVMNSGCTLVNPGSMGEPRDGAAESYAVIEITGGRMEPKIVHV